MRGEDLYVKGFQTLDTKSTGNLLNADAWFQVPGIFISLVWVHTRYWDVQNPLGVFISFLELL